MFKIAVAAVLFMFSVTSLCSAEYWEMDLSAGSDHVTGGIHYKAYLDSGFLRIGGTGVFTDDEETEYKWGSLDLTVGSDTVRPGLVIDVGLRGLVGEAEEPGVSGDVGAIGFTAAASYLFPPDDFLLPFEILTGVTWAPKPLSFSDSEMFFEFTVGLGLRIIRAASIIASYSYYHLEMDSGPADWSLNDNIFRAGLVIHF